MAYDRKGSVAQKKEEKTLDISLAAWHQDELNGGKTPVVK
jgi:hypothetical protein